MQKLTRTDELEVKRTFTMVPRKDAGSEREARVADLPSYERFEALTEKLLKVPKEKLDEKRSEQEKARKRKQN